MYAAGRDPRLVLPPRGPPLRGRDPHLPADRPPAAPDLRQGPAQRGPGRHHRHGAQPRRTSTTCVAINAASASTQLAGLPFSGPIGGVRVALIDGQWVASRRHTELEEAVFDMVVAGRVARRRRRRDHDGRGRGHREDHRAGQGRRHRADRGGRGRGPRGRQAVHQRAVRGAVRAGRRGRQADRRVPGLPGLPGRRVRGASAAAVADELAAGADHRRQAGARGRARPGQGRRRREAARRSSRAARRRSPPRTAR